MGVARPLVSVVLVVRNEENGIRRVIDEIVNQDYPQDRLEILVVDGKSDDRTVELARAARCGAATLRVVPLLESGRSQALNCAIRMARGEFIARIDARTSIERDYIARCVETLERTGADNVGGVQCPIWKSRRQAAFAIALAHPFGVGNAQFRLGKRSGLVDSVYLGCFRRSVFERIGLFDEDAAVISEDSDINYRIRKSGGSVYLNKDIKAYYYPRETFAQLWKLYFRYGGARAGTLLKHGSLTAWRQALPPLYLLILVGSAVLSLVSRSATYIFFAASCGYVCTNLIVSTAATLRRRQPMLAPLLALAFCCMHFGYASGLWKRLLVSPRRGSYWGG